MKVKYNIIRRKKEIDIICSYPKKISAKIVRRIEKQQVHFLIVSSWELNKGGLTSSSYCDGNGITISSLLEKPYILMIKDLLKNI